MPQLPKLSLNSLDPEDVVGALKSLVNQLNTWQEEFNVESHAADIGEGSLVLQNNQLLLTKPSGTQVIIVGQQDQNSAVDEEGNFQAITGDSIEADSITANNISSLSFSGKSAVFDTGSIGGFDMGADYLRDSANSFGLASTITGGDDTRFWAGAPFASRATAPFKVTESGIVTASDGTSSFTLSGNGTLTGQVTDEATGVVLFDVNQQATVVISEDSAYSIQDAIDYLDAHGGGKVFIKNGTYVQSADIVVPSNVTLEGETANAVVIDFNSTANQVLVEGTLVYSTGTVAIDNGTTTVTGSGTTFDVSMEGSYIFISGVYYLIVTVNSTTSLEIEVDFEPTSVTGAATLIADTKTNVTLQNFTVISSTDAAGGVSFRYVVDSSIDTVSVFDSTIGVNYRDCWSVTAKGFFVSGCGIGFNISNLGTVTLYDFETYANTANFVIDKLVNASVANFTLSSSTGNNMTITNSSNWDLYDFSSFLAGAKGVEISTSSQINIFGANISNSVSDGLKFTTGVDNCAVHNVTLVRSGGYGINIANANCDGNILSANFFDTNTSGTTNNLGTGTIIQSGTVTGINTGDQTISDATITTTDIITNDATTAKHGFLKKLDNSASHFLDGQGNWSTPAGAGDALKADPLSQFAATTSLQLKGVISDETGSGALVFGTNPTISAPTISDFTNMAHDHGDADDGGSLANAIITPDKLALSPDEDYVATVEGTTSAFPVDLATSGPSVTVTIGANGIAMVFLSTRMINSAATGSNQMGFAASGANTIAGADSYSLVKVGDAAQRFGAPFLLTGLTPGSTTFTAKYGRGTTGTATFSDRRIAVVPL